MKIFSKALILNHFAVKVLRMSSSIQLNAWLILTFLLKLAFGLTKMSDELAAHIFFAGSKATYLSFKKLFRYSRIEDLDGTFLGSPLHGIKSRPARLLRFPFKRILLPAEVGE